MEFETIAEQVKFARRFAVLVVVAVVVIFGLGFLAGIIK